MFNSYNSRWLILLALAIPCLAQQSELFEAARLGDLTKLKLLVGNKSLIAARGVHYRTALHEAATNCQLEAAKLLVENGWDRLARDEQGKTPLMLASRCPNNIQTAFLGTLTVPPQIREKDPWSLQHAAAYRQTNVVSMLLKLGVDVNAPGQTGIVLSKSLALTAMPRPPQSFWNTAQIRIFAAKTGSHRSTTRRSAEIRKSSSCW